MDEETFLQSFQYGLTNGYISAMAASLFVYDSIISFDLERRAVWSHNITGATALYLALRYVTLVTVIMYIIVYTVSSCEGLFVSNLVGVGTSCGRYLAQAAFASIRVYAVDGRRWTKATIVMMLGLVPVALDIYSTSGTSVYCTTEVLILNHSLTTFEYNKLLLVTRICVLTSNLLVVISTWQAAHANRQVGAWDSRGSLIAVLLRDGTIHFALVVALNAADITSALLTGAKLDFAEPVEYISTVVLCRLFLNLRQCYSNTDVTDSTVSSNGSSFSGLSSRIIGNLDEMLEDDPPALNDDMDDELGEHPGMRESDLTNGPPDDAKTISTSRMATTALCKQETRDAGAPNCEPLAAPDEGIGQHTIDIF